MNPLYEQMQPQQQPQQNNMLAQLQRFAQGYSGDPRQQIQQMLQSGQLPQDRLNAAIEQARQIQRSLFGR